MAGQQKVKLFEYFVPITSLWARFYFGKEEERKDLLNISVVVGFVCLVGFFSNKEPIQLNAFIGVSAGCYLPLDHCSQCSTLVTETLK